jgi:hypothetical protein
MLDSRGAVVWSVLLSQLSTLHAFSPSAPHRRTRTRALSVCAAEEQRGGLGGLFDEGKARIWRELQVGAMQEELDPLPSELKDAPPVVPLGDTSPLPDNFEDSLLKASKAVTEALADGTDRLVIEFDTSAGDETYGHLSRTNTFVQPFLPQLSALLAPPAADGEGVSFKDLPKMQILFPDEGTSAYVANNWQLPPNTVTGSMPRAKIAEGIAALLLVAPAATEVNAVQRLIQDLDETSANTVLILFNPKLVDMQSTGYGLVGRDLRNMVEQSFLQCFVLKSYAAGALYRVYPEPYSVWREDAEQEGGYVLSYSGVRRPSGDELDDLLFPEDDDEDGGGGGDPFAGLQKFIKGFQAI